MRGKWALALLPVAVIIGCGSSGGTDALPSSDPTTQEAVTESPEPTDAYTPPVDEPTSEPAVETPEPATTSDDATAIALVSWWDGGGKNKTAAIMSALTDVGSASEEADSAGVNAACLDLSSAVTGAMSYGPLPDAEAQQHWSNALAELRSAAIDCVTGTSTFDSDTITRAGEELKAGTAEVNLVNARIRTVAGLS